MIDKYGMDQNIYHHIMKYVRNSNNKKLGTIFYALRCMIDVDKDDIEIKTEDITYLQCKNKNFQLKDCIFNELQFQEIKLHLLIFVIKVFLKDIKKEKMNLTQKK